MTTRGPSDVGGDGLPGRPRGLLPRVALAAIALACALLALSRGARADGETVPAGLQAELLAKLVNYDRSFGARAGALVRTVVLVKGDDARSRLAGATFKSALANIERIGGLPHEEVVVTYKDAKTLAVLCRDTRVATVYVTPGFDAEIESLRAALTGVDVLSVSSVPGYVASGIVLGFELVSGKPKILLNLEQSKRQNVQFKPEALKLMQVYR